MTQDKERYIVTVENGSDSIVCFGYDRQPFISDREDAVELQRLLQEQNSDEVYRVWRLDNGIL